MSRVGLKEEPRSTSRKKSSPTLRGWRELCEVKQERSTWFPPLLTPQEPIMATPPKRRALDTVGEKVLRYEAFISDVLQRDLQWVTTQILGVTFEKFHVVGGIESRPNFRIGREASLMSGLRFGWNLALVAEPLMLFVGLNSHYEPTMFLTGPFNHYLWTSCASPFLSMLYELSSSVKWESLWGLLNVVGLSFKCVSPGKECNPKPSVITQDCNSSTREAEAGGSSKAGD